ncbi:NAD(P)-dependent oxidoreductase [Ramlibacter sp.]|uniref:NAD(P)-dependent oxidoreductase n=1 Tax=Ramlibacter sp. TaxID=1917967 RepID=UPI002602B9AE|nr:NAD(P)-dependent oxidoreductase [Ramlibacter sp.]MDB5958204.1 D-3-phosphoglycerate dehydrogenase [Ramlibacter sp.]
MTAKPRVLLTNPMHPQVQPVLAQHCEVVLAPDTKPDTLTRLVAEVDALVVRAQLPPTIFDNAGNLRAVVRHGVGLDMIPVEAATARGIPVANLPGSNTQAVVEYCLAAMLHLRRGLATMDAGLRSRGWAVARPLADTGAELGSGTCGIVGVGAIGSRLAQVASAMGMRVLGLTRRPSALPAGIEAVAKHQLFSQADVVVLCCPLNDQTRGLVDAATLATMKRDAILINVSRGPVIDTAALVSALRAGKLGGAALDVHDRQPLTGGEPIFEAPNLLLTPHVAGITDTSMRAMSHGTVATVLALLRGERPANVVNPQVFR